MPATVGTAEGPTLTAAFSSSNTECKVLSHSLTAGASEYEVTGKDTFSVTLLDAATVGTYPYTIKALADGGASATVSNKMVIYQGQTEWNWGNFKGEYTNERKDDGKTWVIGIKVTKAI